MDTDIQDAIVEAITKIATMAPIHELRRFVKVCYAEDDPTSELRCEFNRRFPPGQEDAQDVLYLVALEDLLDDLFREKEQVDKPVDVEPEPVHA